MSLPRFTAPGLSLEDGATVAKTLQDRLYALNDLALTLKHVHWNVVGPHFIAVHEMLDPHEAEVREAIDETAERIATLGVAPDGTSGAIVAERSWSNYSLGRASTNEHLGALDEVYTGLIEDHRKARAIVEDLDPVTEDLLIDQIGKLELFQWFIRAHLENTSGVLSTADAEGEAEAASAASDAVGEDL